MQGIVLFERAQRISGELAVTPCDNSLSVICVRNSEQSNSKISRVDEGRTQNDFSIEPHNNSPLKVTENMPEINNSASMKMKDEARSQGASDIPQPTTKRKDVQKNDINDMSATANGGCVSVKPTFSEISGLPPEPEEGNVEYKRTLASASKSRFEHLVTQLKWRLEEGNGIAVYEIGVEDDGRLTGLNDHDLEWSLETLRRMARCLGASCRVIEQRDVMPNGNQPSATRMRFGRRRNRAQAADAFDFAATGVRTSANGENGHSETDPASCSCSNGNGNGNCSRGSNSERRRVAEVEIRRIAPALARGETRIALLGDADAGKSTLIAVLTHGELDNARGRARLHLFRHRHEIESGRSSSSSLEIVGVSETHETVSYATAYSVGALFEASRHVIAFVDLAGHPRFVRTTLSGLTSYAPQLTLLVVSASSSISAVTRDHFQVARALKLPVVIVVNKTDQHRSDHAVLFERLANELLPHDVSGGDAGQSRLFVVDSPSKVPEALNVVALNPSSIVVFAVSCVSGENLPLLQSFINGLPDRLAANDESQESTLLKAQNDLAALSMSGFDNEDDSGEFLVDGVLTISQLGKVLCGTVVRGTLSEGDAVRIGPDLAGRFCERTVSSIQRFGLGCRSATAGQTASLYLGRLDDFEPRKGHVVTRDSLERTCERVAREFEARVQPFDLSSALREKMEVTVHCRNVTQTCTVVSVRNKDGSSTSSPTRNETVSQSDAVVEQLVRLRFLKQPEYLRVDTPIVFRGSRARGVGSIVQLLPMSNEPNRRVVKRSGAASGGSKSQSFCESVSCAERLNTVAVPSHANVTNGSTGTGTNTSTSNGAGSNNGYTTGRTRSAAKACSTRYRLAESQTHELERTRTESHCHA